MVVRAVSPFFETKVGLTCIQDGDVHIGYHRSTLFTHHYTRGVYLSGAVLRGIGDALH